MKGSSSITAQIWDVWKRLGPHWAPYFKSAGLDLTKATRENFREVLTAPVKIDFRIPGLEDLSPQCHRGVEPGDPALSLFYHALASPHAHPSKIASGPEAYPTIADLEIVENFIYAAAEMTVDKIRARANGQPLAIVVFAYEYAPAEDTVHGLHADLCFSRTGISRVGNAPPHYEPQARGFFPYVESSTKAHVVPARFGAFLAVQQKGRRGKVGPQDFIEGDGNRGFWVPVHKLFRGPECLKTLDLDLSFEVLHVNEKIRKVHEQMQLEAEKISPGKVVSAWTPEQMATAPFVITEELASFCQSQGLMIPCVHDPLVAPAKIDDQKGDWKYLGFEVPANHDLGESALWLDKDANTRSSPEFVHIRYKIDEQNPKQLVYLPDATSKDIVEVLKQGGFQAANFVDWTADGYIKANCPALAQALNGGSNQTVSLAAYSILAQPDFFPLVTQRGLTAWAKQSPLAPLVWPDRGIVPDPLSESRLAANVTLKGAAFDAADTTVSAIVGTPRPAQPGEVSLQLKRDQPMRQSTLSYRSSSLFAPGWDIGGSSLDPDTAKGPAFMANYGLGSPFPEDTLICSALGSFWPGAAPDITRFFAPNSFPNTTPMLDSEANWPAVQPPTLRDTSIDFQSVTYADFVKALYEGRFNYARFARVSLSDYILRTGITARFYQFLQATEKLNAMDPTKRLEYVIASFDTGRIPEQVQGKWTASGEETFKIRYGKAQNVSGNGFHPRTAPSPTPSPDPKITTTLVDSLREVYVGPSQAAYQDRSGNWNVVALP